MSKARDLADLGAVTDRLDTVGASDGALSNRNLIINGAMQVAQRGTSGSTPITDNYLLDQYTLSRFGGYPDNATQTQESDAPTGHYKSFKMVRNSAYTLTGTNASAFLQRIEGQNVAHLNWGTSSAQPVTVSFWVKSNKTGDFPFIVADSGNAYDIGKLYNIALANTWEYKTIQIDAPTSGTFDTDNTVGLMLYWGFGAIDAARTAQGTTWGASNSAGGSKAMVTGASTALATDNGATWQITGVQLEVGDTATPFEHRSYGDELARCQRYYYIFQKSGDSASNNGLMAHSYNANSAYMPIQFPVEMRASPTFNMGGLWSTRLNNNNSFTPSGAGIQIVSKGGGVFYSGVPSLPAATSCWIEPWSADASHTAYMTFHAEL